MSDVEQTRDLFKGRSDEQALFASRILAKPPNAPLFWISGPGGIGKTALLSRFEEVAIASACTPVRASLEEARTAPEVLLAMRNSCQTLPFKKFNAVTAQLTSIWTRSSPREENAITKRLATLGKDIAGPSVGGAIGFGVGGPPGLFIGAAIGAAAGMATEEVIQRTLGLFRAKGLSIEEATFATNPVPKLTQAFLEDIESFIKRQKMVLMIDGFERGSHLNAWIRLDLLGSHKVVTDKLFVVIAGRELAGPEWAHFEKELVPFPLHALRENEAREYFEEVGIQRPERIAALVAESSCVPWLVELLADAELTAPSQGGNQQFLRSTARFVSRALDHLSSDQRALVETASTLRELDQDVLSSISDAPVSSDAFSQFTSLTFVEFRADRKWAIQQVVRNRVEAALMERSPDTFRKCHARALSYYLTKLAEPGTPKVADVLEAIYHATRAERGDALRTVDGLFLRIALPPNFPACDASIAEIACAIERNDFPKGWDKYYMGRVHYLKNEWDAAELCFTGIANSQEPEIALHARALEQLGWIELHRGKLKPAFDHFERAHGFFESLDDREEVETLLNHLGRISRRLGNRALALEYHKKVLTAAGEQSGAESQGVIEAHRCLARLYRDFGRWADAAASLETSRQIARSQGDRYDEALAISRKAEIECLLGSWQEARLDCSVALGMLSKYENDLALAGTFENTGRLSTWVGANDEALSNYISALWCYTRLSAKVGIALSFVDLARHYQLENVLSRALEYSAQASAIAQGVGDLVLKAVALNVNANARRLSGDASQAAEAFRANLKCLEEGGDSYHAAEAAIGVAACLLQEGKDTSQALKDAHKHLDGSNYPDLASKYKVIVGLAAHRSGKKMALKIISEGICDARKFSPRLAESLRSELSVLWNVRIASSDPETARTNTMSDDILESISVAAGPDLLKLKLPAPLLKVRRGQKLVVLHHGLTSMRHDGRIQGRIDAGLMQDCRPAIVANSKAITERLQGLGVDLRTIRVLSAPARRAYETAFIVVDELRGQSRQIPVLRVRRSLENIGLGDWEGQCKQDLAMSENWIALSSGRNFSVAAPGRSTDGTGPESLREVINRVYGVLSELVEDDASAILVGHKMSLIIPAILLFSPTLLVDADQVLNWRGFDFSPGTGLIISEDSIERVAGRMIG